MFNRNVESENFADTTQIQDLDVMIPEQSLQTNKQIETQKNSQLQNINQVEGNDFPSKLEELEPQIVDQNITVNQDQNFSHGQEIVFPSKMNEVNQKQVDQNPDLNVMIPETAVAQNNSGLEEIDMTNKINNNEVLEFPTKLDNMTPRESPLERLDRIRIRPDLNFLDNRPQPAKFTQLVAGKSINSPNRDQISGRNPQNQLQKSNSQDAISNIKRLEQEYIQNSQAIQKIANQTKIDLTALKKDDTENERRMKELEQLQVRQKLEAEARKKMLAQNELNRQNRGEGIGQLNSIKILQSNIQNTSSETKSVQPILPNLETLSKLPKNEKKMQIMIPEQSTQTIKKKERFIIFGENQEEEIKYQLLLSRILNLGMLSMFTDLTDQETTISLLLVLKQIEQIAGKDLFKVIFKIENPKYATGAIFYGAEFAVEGSQGIMTNANEIDFISFGKSVLLRNVMNLLSLDKKYLQKADRLDFLNKNRDGQGRDFSGQSKAAMVEFIQTILTITGNAQNSEDTKSQQTQDNVIQQINKEESQNGLEIVPVEVDEQQLVGLEEMPEEQKVVEEKDAELIGSHWKDDMEFGG